jgi:hypothetical protein
VPERADGADALETSMRPIIKDGRIMRDEDGNWTTHSIPQSFTFPVYYAVLAALSFDQVRTFDDIVQKTIGRSDCPVSSPDLKRCLVELESLQCVRRADGGWVAMRAAECKLKGGPFPLDHILHQPIPRY